MGGVGVGADSVVTGAGVMSLSTETTAGRTGREGEASLPSGRDRWIFGGLCH